MGSANGTLKLSSLTASDIAEYVSNIGELYKKYHDIIIGNGIDGELINSLGDEEIQDFFQELGSIIIIIIIIIIKLFL